MFRGLNHILITNRLLKLSRIIVVIVVVIAAVMVTAQDADNEAKIESAMSAAPLQVAEDAAILDWAMDEEGSFVVLREGTNGWSCFPDNPGSPGNDPACFDQTWLDWLGAYVTGTEPNLTSTGLAYMLQGGSEPSMTDPLALEPVPGEDWTTTPPHIMVIFPSDMDMPPYSTDHLPGEPYIMWAGTPYQHIMMPVTDEHPHDE